MKAAQGVAVHELRHALSVLRAVRFERVVRVVHVVRYIAYIAAKELAVDVYVATGKNSAINEYIARPTSCLRLSYYGYIDCHQCSRIPCLIDYKII